MAPLRIISEVGVRQSKFLYKLNVAEYAVPAGASSLQCKCEGSALVELADGDASQEIEAYKLCGQRFNPNNALGNACV